MQAPSISAADLTRNGSRALVLGIAGLWAFSLPLCCIPECPATPSMRGWNGIGGKRNLTHGRGNQAGLEILSAIRHGIFRNACQLSGVS